MHFLLGSGDATPRWLHELIRAAVNAAIGVPIFFLLDRTRMNE